MCIEAYPDNTTFKMFSENPELILNQDEKFRANVIYLQQHGLISIEHDNSDDPFNLLERLKATHKGVDFMLDDGGVSAILNVHTIKVHRDTIIVLEDLIAISNMSTEEKKMAKSAIAQLSSEALKSIIQTITAAGISALIR
jgi:hypothetical protein